MGCIGLQEYQVAFTPCNANEIQAFDVCVPAWSAFTVRFCRLMHLIKVTRRVRISLLAKFIMKVALAIRDIIFTLTDKHFLIDNNMRVYKRVINYLSGRFHKDQVTGRYVRVIAAVTPSRKAVP